MVTTLNHQTFLMKNGNNIMSNFVSNENLSLEKKGDFSPPVIRSVAMSANIANAVQDEVKHLIKVNTLPLEESIAHYEVRQTSPAPSEENSDVSDTYSADHDSGSLDMQCGSICAHVLPNDDESIVCAVVLSRWDDIMGPRTIRVWLPENVSDQEASSVVETTKFTSPRNVKAACQFNCLHQMPEKYNKILLMKAIKYVTSHTVNYTCVTGTSAPEERSSAIFVVPDLDMVAQSLMFHVPLSGSCPYSLALVVSFNKYSTYLPVRKLCQHWLERLTMRLADFLLSISGTRGMDGIEIPPSTMVDSWMLEMCNVLISLQVNGLGELGALQSYLLATTLGNPIVERAVTSHLQTGGCTIVMGNNTSEINAMISFLALFLDEEARCCSRLVQSGQRDTFQTGLFLQGLILDEFGCRDLSSEELVDNPLPVTWVDLSKSTGASSAVRQGLPMHRHQTKADQSEVIMKVFKGDSNMVRGLICDLRQLPSTQWAGVVGIFMHHLHKLAMTLLNVVHWNGVPSLSDRTGNKNDNPYIRHLRATLHVDDATFLMILAQADKIRPGAYRLIMDGSET